MSRLSHQPYQQRQKKLLNPNEWRTEKERKQEKSKLKFKEFAKIYDRRFLLWLFIKVFHLNTLGDGVEAARKISLGSF
jgi:hypothetical protein